MSYLNSARLVGEMWDKMIIKEENKLNSGLLFQGDRLIGIVDGGKIEQKYFVPDRFLYNPVHKDDDESRHELHAAPPCMPVRFVGHMDIDEEVNFYETKENPD